MEQITGGPASQVQVVCGEVASHCICDEPPKHDDRPHLCKCGGSWFGTLDGDDFEVVAWPVAVKS